MTGVIKQEEERAESSPLTGPFALGSEGEQCEKRITYILEGKVGARGMTAVAWG